MAAFRLDLVCAKDVRTPSLVSTMIVWAAMCSSLIVASVASVPVKP